MALIKDLERYFSNASWLELVIVTLLLTIITCLTSVGIAYATGLLP